MARLLRIEFPGAIYHITVRMLGDARAVLFKDDRDRRRFLEQLEERVEDHDIRLYAFCLMRNHFHLVAETPRGNLSRFMHALSTAYSTYYNLRHQRHGHLVDGRYGAKLVEGDEYLLTLSRYVHLNPIRVKQIKSLPAAHKIRHLDGYPWTSYQGYVNKKKALAFVDYDPLLAEMGGGNKDRRRRYREFARAGIEGEDKGFMDAMAASRHSIGSEDFRNWVYELYQELLEEYERPEDVAFRRILVPLEPGAVLAEVSKTLGVPDEEFKRRQRGSPLRAIAAKFLYRYAGLTQRQIGEFLGVGTGAAVSAQLIKLPETIAKDKRLRTAAQRIKERLEGLRNASTSANR